MSRNFSYSPPIIYRVKVLGNKMIYIEAVSLCDSHVKPKLADMAQEFKKKKNLQAIARKARLYLVLHLSPSLCF